MRTKIEVYSDILYYAILYIRMFSARGGSLSPCDIAKAREWLRFCYILSYFIHNIPRLITYEQHDDQDVWFMSRFPQMLTTDKGECISPLLLKLCAELYSTFPEAMKSGIEWSPPEALLVEFGDAAQPGGAADTLAGGDDL